MTAALRIARDEVTRRWPLLLAALAIGLLAFAIAAATSDPVYSELNSPRYSELANTCMFGAIVLSWGAAFVIGMTLVGRPLHDGRLAFYFTRPVGGYATAAGKIGGGLALVLAMELALIAPLVVFDSETLGESGAFAIAMAVVFLAAGLAVGILARSRSRWFLVDAIGATTASLIALAMFARIDATYQQIFDALRWRDAPTNASLSQEEAWTLLHRADLLVRGVIGVAVAAVFAAVVVAVATGRTDRERVHRALTITLWSSVVITTTIGLAIARWGFL